MRVAEFAADWPYSHPRPRPETNRHYRQMVGRFVERFGDRALTSVTTAEVQIWAMDHLSSVRFVRAMFADAMLDGHLAVNPLAKVKVPRPPRRRRDDAVPSKEEVQILLDAAGDQLGAVVALGAITGLRQAEVLGLGYGSLQPDLGRAFVHQQLGRLGDMKPLKGKVKAREVDIFAWARPYIEAWSTRQESDDRLVVGPLTYSELRAGWDDLRRRTGIGCEFHQLRTFCASWMLELGASPIDVAVQLHGHTDPTVVLSYYAMIDKSRALERLRRIVDGEA
jgi:integrase